MDGDADFGSAGHHILLNTYFDLPSTTAFVESKYVSRLPRQEVNLNNIITPFDHKTWMWIIVSLAAFSIFFMTAHRVYKCDHLKDYKLARTEKFLPINFFILTFGLFTEPELLPWFKVKWSAGKVGTGLWLLLAAHMLTFYNSNLRAHLISIDVEKPIDTLQGVLDNGKRVWMYQESLGLR